MAESRLQRMLGWIALGLLGAALAVTAYWLLFTAFMFYDDEGYVLISLRNFSLHGALYDRVYTQYGPFPYLLYDLLHRGLGFAFNNTSGRWITLFNWLGTAGAGAALVRRFTHSQVWTAFTLAGVFAYLWVMINEPVHPGGLISSAVALAAWLGAEAWAARRIKLFLGIVGVIGACLLLTKINVGVFFAGAAFAWCALHSTPDRLARMLAWLAAVGCAALPFVLMRALFDEPWVRVFALVFACSSLGLLLVARTTARPLVTGRAWLFLMMVVAGTIALLCLLTVQRGTSWRALVDGVVFEPLRHPGVYSFAMLWRTGTGLVALASLGFAAWLAWKQKWRQPRCVEAIAWLRLVAAALYLSAPLGLITTTQPGWGMSYGISLAWIFVVPLQPDERSASARAWIALLLVFQFLQAYPVAGSQINWGTFLWVPLLALGLHDAAPLWRARLGAAGPKASLAATTALLAVTLVMGGKFFQLGWTRYSTSRPLGLSGAENLRMPEDVTSTLRIVTENLQAHSDMLMSAPGLYSANLWTGLPTPTLANATHWFSLLTPAQQQAIIASLEEHPNAALLVQRGLLDFLVKNGFARHGPLQAWLMSHFEPAIALYPYEIWFRRGRSIAPLSTAQRREADSPTTGTVVLTLRAPTAPVARIEVCPLLQPRSPVATFDARNARVSISPIHLDGTPAAPPADATFPFTCSGYVDLSLHYSERDGAAWGAGSVLVLRGVDGAVLAEVRVVPSSAVRRRATMNDVSAKM